MHLSQKLKHELQALGLAMLYFGCWIGALILLKELILAEYQIAFHGLSVALVGALVLSKVVLILEHVSLGEKIRTQPAWVDAVLRTTLYSCGVAVVLVLEKSFETRHEEGGFGPALAALFHKTDIRHVCVTTICISGALFGYNILSVVRRHLGEGGLRRIFLTPLPGSTKAS